MRARTLLPWIVLAASAGGPAHAWTGVDERTLLVDGGVVYSATGTSAGTYFARGLAEYLFSRNLGFRVDGFGQFTDPTMAGELKIRLSGVNFGIVVHPLARYRFDPYVLASAGAAFATGDGFRAAPALTLAAGLNIHLGRAFVSLQVGWHLADMLFQRGGVASLNDIRAQLGVGFSFDLARK